MTRRTPGTEILLLYRFPVAAGLLTPDVLAKLAPYLTRYAQTLNVVVHAAGGVADHLHLLADVPTDMPADRVPKELLAPATRYLRDVLGMTGFDFDVGAVSVVSVSPTESAVAAAYVSEQMERHASGNLVVAWEAVSGFDDASGADETLPAWLAGAMPAR